MTGVQLDSDLAVAALRFQNTGESDEVVVNGWSPGLPGTPKKQDHAGEGARATQSLDSLVFTI
jgi:hypothetical protein